jgi:hypothetical protein
MRHKKNGVHRVNVMAWLTIGGKLMTYWSVFLLCLEGICYIGITIPISRTLDQMAIVFTILLLFISTFGLKWVTDRFVQESRKGDKLPPFGKEVSNS